jgi:hypothetical protein
MVYELTASGTFTTWRSPGEPVPRRGSYRVAALFPIGAELAAHQLFLADAKAAGFSPAGPVAISGTPA